MFEGHSGACAEAGVRENLIELVILMEHKSTVLVEDLLASGIRLRWRQSETDICLMAVMDVSDSINSMEIFHFSPLLCSEREWGWGRGMNVKYKE